MNKKIKRIVILYSKPAPYTIACLRALKARYQVEIIAFFWNSTEDAPFNLNSTSIIDRQYVREDYTTDQIKSILVEFDPQAIYVTGWMDFGYLSVARHFKKAGIPVIAGLDGQWRGSFKQWIAVLIGKYYLHTCIDVLWVTGERQAEYARRLGFTGPKMWHGFYCCDWNRYAEVFEQRTGQREKAFFYLGRYVPEKGLDALMDAYRLYRKRTETPWNLYCAGAGPLKHILKEQAGVKDLGFMQPEAVPDLMRRYSVFVLPSKYEPWGVVIQEAAAAGLPIICSDACGAGVHLVQDKYNGFVFEAAQSAHLAECMVLAHNLSEEKFNKMAVAGHTLSKQFTPERWADTFFQGIENLSK